MKDIYLPATQLTVSVPDCVHYHDDGIVNDLAVHTVELGKKYGLLRYLTPWGKKKIVDAFKKEKNLDSAGGVCLPMKWFSLLDGPNIDIHTYVLSGQEPQFTQFVRGHEETEALVFLNRLSVLEQALEEEDVDSTELRYLPKEAICHVGGLYALRNHNDLTLEPPDENVNELIDFMRSSGLSTLSFCYNLNRSWWGDTSYTPKVTKELFTQ